MTTSPILRLGKLDPAHDDRTLMLKSYLMPALPTPPPEVDYDQHVIKPFPMDGNDAYGDCTRAAIAHMVQVWSALRGREKVPSEASVINAYKRMTGCKKPGDAHDTGLVELDVLKDCRAHAVDGDKILAFAKIDKNDLTTMRQAIWLFGGVYIGFACTREAQEQFGNGQPWTSGPKDIEGGHAVNITAYNSSMLRAVTWGRRQSATYSWWEQYVDEAWAIIPPEVQTKPITGFNLAQLESDLRAIAS